MTHSHRIRRLALAATAALAALAAAFAAAAAFDRGDTPRARLVVDLDRPLFAASNLLPGETRTACMTVANRGDASGRAALYAPGMAGDLAPFVRLTVTRGTHGGAAPACTSFAADRATYGATEPGVVFAGRLSDFPTRLSDALLDPAAWQPGARHTYRFELALGDDPAAAGRTARWDWRLAVDSLAAPEPTGTPSSASSAASSRAPTAGCRTVQLAGTGIGRARKLVRTVRVSRRVRAVLILRTATARGTTRVSLTTGLRVRNGKTLVIPRWARVRYRLNGRLAVAARRRPFRGSMPAAAFRPGMNRISVAVQRRRGGRKRTTAFSLKVTPTTIAGRDVCVVSA